jgi:hypothetical protein
MIRRKVEERNPGKREQPKGKSMLSVWADVLNSQLKRELGALQRPKEPEKSVSAQ